MNLRSIDLNLLVILEALLDEAHVSRAAQRLGLTQPAVSAALQRLRGLFGDELLQRGRGTMRRTRRAEALRAPLKTLLAGVHDLVDPPEIPLHDIRQTIRLVMTDNVAELVLPALFARLADSAPGIDIVMPPWHGTDGVHDELLSGEIDLALSVFEHEMPGIERRLVLEEGYVVVMRRGHPALADFDLDRWLAYPHIVVSGHGDRRGSLDAHLERIGRSRRVGLVVPSFQLVPGVLLATDHIAMLPAHSIAIEQREELEVVAPPLPIRGFPLHFAWPARGGTDKGLRHVVDTLSELLTDNLALAARDCPALRAAE